MESFAISCTATASVDTLAKLIGFAFTLSYCHEHVFYPGPVCHEWRLRLRGAASRARRHAPAGEPHPSAVRTAVLAIMANGSGQGGRLPGIRRLETLVVLRKWEISAVCLFFMLFPWFVAEYTGIRPRRLLVGLSVFWSLIFIAQPESPYGVQYADLPRLTLFRRALGRTRGRFARAARSPWHIIGWGGILVVMAFGLDACVAQYRRDSAKGHARWPGRWAVFRFHRCSTGQSTATSSRSSI